MPQDFFDDGLQFESIVGQNVLNSNEKNELNSEKSSLPKGFFDDPLLDAKSRKGKNVIDPFEEQMQLFRKEIAQESIVSEEILEEEIEQIQREKTIAEIEEQINNWEKVDNYQKKIEAIHKEKERLSLSSTKKVADEESSDGDGINSSDEDDQDMNEMQFWRNKGAFG